MAHLIKKVRAVEIYVSTLTILYIFLCEGSDTLREGPALAGCSLKVASADRRVVKWLEKGAHLLCERSKKAYKR